MVVRESLRMLQITYGMVVCDDYREFFIKYADRTRRATDKECIRNKDIEAGQIIRK